MKVLVANLGSTSFKFRLFDMRTRAQVARGGMERIGSAVSPWFVEIGDRRTEGESAMRDHGDAVRHTLNVLADAERGCLRDANDIAAIGFKAVHGGRYSGVQRVTDDVLAAMEEMNDVAPAHNPPYIAAMRLLADRFPDLPLVAAFETGFHRTIPDGWSHYGIPLEWSTEHGVRRCGFHGASHRYISERTAEIAGRTDLRVVSCHLGGSSSLCAIASGASVATTMGMSPQSGLLHNNRVGDFDPFALPVLMRATGKTLPELLEELANRSGLLGLSGLSGDMRDLEGAADAGDARARLAIDVFIADTRRHLGAMLVALGGADWIVFTGGIGEHGSRVRSAVCERLEEFGVVLDSQRNDAASGEARISADTSRTEVWVVPTNEEWIVAQQVASLLEE